MLLICSNGITMLWVNTRRPHIKDEEFRRWFRALIEWEPFPKDKARDLLDRILKILFGYRSQLLLEDYEKKEEADGKEKTIDDS